MGRFGIRIDYKQPRCQSARSFRLPWPDLTWGYTPTMHCVMISLGLSNPVCDTICDQRILLWTLSSYMTKRQNECTNDVADMIGQQQYLKKTWVMMSKGNQRWVLAPHGHLTCHRRLVQKLAPVHILVLCYQGWPYQAFFFIQTLK
jgi:hypothetical protein